MGERSGREGRVGWGVETGGRRNRQIFTQREESNTRVLTNFLFVVLAALVVIGTASAQTRSATDRAVTVAVGGTAFVVKETENGVEKNMIKTQRRVMSAFGFAPDNITSAYNSINVAGL